MMPGFVPKKAGLLVPTRQFRFRSVHSPTAQIPPPYGRFRWPKTALSVTLTGAAPKSEQDQVAFEKSSVKRFENVFSTHC